MSNIDYIQKLEKDQLKLVKLIIDSLNKDEIIESNYLTREWINSHKDSFDDIELILDFLLDEDLIKNNPVFGDKYHLFRITNDFVETFEDMFGYCLDENFKLTVYSLAKIQRERKGYLRSKSVSRKEMKEKLNLDEIESCYIFDELEWQDLIEDKGQTLGNYKERVFLNTKIISKAKELEEDIDKTINLYSSVDERLLDELEKLNVDISNIKEVIRRLHSEEKVLSLENITSTGIQLVPYAGGFLSGCIELNKKRKQNEKNKEIIDKLL